MAAQALPVIIQGGMGAAVSDWRLARAVSQVGQLGVVSGTALGEILGRRLQNGDPGGHMRRALAALPLPRIAEKIIERYFREGGKPDDVPYERLPMFSVNPPRQLVEMTIAANFVEVWLAKEGHDGLVGINYLEKIQLPNLASLYGAMLAGVACVLMGAGIPREIPGVLDRLEHHLPVELSLSVAESLPGTSHHMTFDPATFHDAGTATPLLRPAFLTIVSSASLAAMMARKATGKVDGFVIERPCAGGHNAPPRGAPELNERGEPIYGAKDDVDLARMRELGLPFWLAGGYATPDGLAYALAEGAAGIQVGTAFAFCRESGLAEPLKREVLLRALDGSLRVLTDPRASPTGFPFKVVELPGTNAESGLYRRRCRICDFGYLREVYLRPDGEYGYRCPSEPESSYVAKGGAREDTIGRKCLCNGLLANIGMSQLQAKGGRELPLLTAGDDVCGIARFLHPGEESYAARDVIRNLLSKNVGAPSKDT